MQSNVKEQCYCTMDMLKRITESFSPGPGFLPKPCARAEK
jgi:hypothetical protein